MKICFDMDGTIADLYGVNNWLGSLMREDTTPYEVAETLVDMKNLVEVLNKLKELSYKISVISWTSKGGSKEYNKRVRQEKIKWLKKYDFPYDEIHIVKYGTPKHKFKESKIDIIFDDDMEVRDKWKGLAVDPQKVDIIKMLENLL